MSFRTKTPLVAGFLILMLTGCPNTGNVASSTGKSESRSDSDNSYDRKIPPEKLLENAVFQLRPENYSIAAAQDKPVTLLNSWLNRVEETPSKIEPFQAKVPSVPAAWLDERDASRLDDLSFDLRDAVHIRDALLTRAISTYLGARGKTELQRVMAVFDYVVRNITLRGANDLDFPLGTYHLLLMGRGSAEDRAWVCSSILRQLKIDTVIVQSGEKEADTEAWLLGVVLNDHIHLFDPRIGLPIPSSEDLAAPLVPATLDEIISHEEWLRPLALRADQPYVMTVDGLKSCQIFPITEPSFWSHRMKLLEQSLPANELCVLFDPALDDMGQPGLWTRLKSVISDLSPDNEKSKPWTYPRRVNGTINPAMRQQFLQQIQVFELPIPLVPGPEENSVKLGSPERKFLRYRTDQMLGEFEDATKRYLSIRRLEIEPVPVPELAAINRIAAEDAIYWSAVCKFEAKEYEAAIEQLNTYLKRFDRSGRWNFAARALLGDCYAELKQYPAAMGALERSTRSDDPYRLANAIRVKRWAAMGAKSGDQAK